MRWCSSHPNQCIIIGTTTVTNIITLGQEYILPPFQSLIIHYAFLWPSSWMMVVSVLVSIFWHSHLVQQLPHCFFKWDLLLPILPELLPSRGSMAACVITWVIACMFSLLSFFVSLPYRDCLLLVCLTETALSLPIWDLTFISQTI